MKIKIEIDCGNAAFVGNPEQELSRILGELAERLKTDRLGHPILLRDINGNKVGTVDVWDAV